MGAENPKKVVSALAEKAFRRPSPPKLRIFLIMREKIRKDEQCV